MAAAAAVQVGGSSGGGSPRHSVWDGKRRQRFWRWWLASTFQRTWMRLAVQAGFCTLLIMCIFSAPPVWNLHSLDPILANPVLVLVIANLGLLFTVNTGLPAFKIGLEAVQGGLAGGVGVWAVSYAAYGISGGSHEPGVAKAAVVMCFGAVLLLLGTACRFRWPQHVALAGIFFNLTVAVGLAVEYGTHSQLWRFVVYWWWFIGLAVLFMVGVAITVLPLPAGWVVRKQLARALRQEGAIVEAIVALMTAQPDSSACQLGIGEDIAAAAGLGPNTADAEGGPSTSVGAASGGLGQGIKGVPDGSGGYKDFMTLEEGAESWSAAVHWPDGGAPSRLVGGALGRLWRKVSRQGGRTLSRLSLRSLRGSRDDVAAAAAAMGIHPDMYAAVEPIYAMSGPAAASMSAARSHLRYTHLEVDLYRPTHRFPALAFSRMLVLARTLLSASMMMLYPLQTSRARLGASRQHAAHLRQAAHEVRRCCQSLAGVLRDNAPVEPALQQLERLESVFWELQQAVGAAAGAPGPEPNAAAAAAATAAEAAEQLQSAESSSGASGAAAAETAFTDGLASPQEQEEAGAEGGGAAAAAAAVPGMGGGDALAQDSLALHLSLSMLFTCCTRVRSMYMLLPQLVAKDQAGVDLAVAAHFATAHAWDRVLHARTHVHVDTTPSGQLATPRACDSPRDTTGVFRRSQLLLGNAAGQPRGLQSSKSAAALDKLVKPVVQVAEPKSTGEAGPQPGRARGCVQAAFGAVERLTGFNRNQVSLGLQIAVAFVAVMFLVVVPAANEALGHRAVWAVFIIVVVHEPLLGSVIWKCVLRFGGTVVAGLLGLGSLYFAFLCNGLSFENRPPKFIAMTAALVVLTMPLAAGTARYGLQNAYFWIVSCLIMYTVALPGYTHDSPMPTLALWRLACTAIGLVIELVAALLVFPVTARSAAHAVAAAALRDMAQVADTAFHSVLPGGGPGKAGAATAAAGEAEAGAGAGGPPHIEVPSRRGALQRRVSEDAGSPSSSSLDSPDSPAPSSPHASQPPIGDEVQTQQAQQAQQGQQVQQVEQPAHVAIPCHAAAGWHGSEVAAGAVLRRIHGPMMDAYGRITTFRALLVPLRVEYHPFTKPARFPVGPGRRAQRLCRRMLNGLTCFALAMDSHHTETVPLLEPHAAEMEGLIVQLREALRALAAMVAGTVSLSSAARTVAALETHAQHLMLRVLLSGPLAGLSSTDATQGLAFLAMLSNLTSVARLLCVALGESFCAADAEGQAAATALLLRDSRWAADDKLMAMAAELVGEALASTDNAEEGEAEAAAHPASPRAAAKSSGAPGPG